MNDILKTYYLTQQTPLIHFQYNQKGAVLRGSEVKPKLDRFIKKKLNDELKNEWYIPDTDALNYKLQIFATGDCERSNQLGFDTEVYLYRKNHKPEQTKQYIKSIKNEYRLINEMYFGNQVKQDKDFVENAKKSYKETVFYTKENAVELRIICLNNELLMIIDEYIAEFFAVTNFGCRQSKGFGGFTLKKKLPDGTFSEPYSADKITELLKENNYKFFYTEATDCDPLTLAKSVYNAMKTGVNFPNKGRVKGYLLYQYRKDNGYSEGSEKSFIRAEILPGGYDTKKFDDYKFFRALLGLPEEYVFYEGKNKITLNIEGTKKTGEGEKSVSVVQRFPSPVTIKIIGKKVLFIFNEELFSLILGEEFRFSCGDKEEKITVPKTFDIDKFIADFIYYFNTEKSDQQHTEFSPENLKYLPGCVYKKLKEGNSL